MGGTRARSNPVLAKSIPTETMIMDFSCGPFGAKQFLCSIGHHVRSPPVERSAMTAHPNRIRAK